MTTPVPEALKRVRLREDITLDAAAQITVDPTGGGDMADLVINPDIAGPDGTEGYRIRAAVQAALEPFRRYNRAITRRYGTYEREQALFDAAVDKASFELEQLVHLTPTRPAVPELADVALARDVRDAALPDDFPEVEGLREIGVRTYQGVRDATDAELRAVSGVGPKRLEAIREQGQAYYDGK
ncbi:hypothetical protein [uncultured Deinococcus sp.]|uniref:hypothetical protein n=1 Tax=uncultured Deinococcus sp. TaxID=158789 RepID=UPI0025D628D2|nr:hypothetical protein [uncultured Deinococcus sp.]